MTTRDRGIIRSDVEESPVDEPARSPAPRPLGLALLLIVGGALWLVSNAGYVIPWDVVLPAGLIVIGLLLLAGRQWSAHSGLVGLGIVTTIVALVVTASVGAPSVGDTTHTPGDQAALESEYSLGAGNLTLDLSELDLEDDADPTVVSVSIALGELRVVLPPDSNVTGRARVGVGNVSVLGESSGGIGRDRQFEIPAEDTAPAIDLDLRVGLGRITVQQ